jgi:mRNA interferase HicA
MQNKAKKSLFFKGHCLDQAGFELPQERASLNLLLNVRDADKHLDIRRHIAHIFAHKPGAPRARFALETNRNKVAARLAREGWEVRHGGDHDVYKHPTRVGRIVLPRHRTLSPGVARAVARQAGWPE